MKSTPALPISPSCILEDSIRWPYLIIGANTPGKIELLTFMHQYGAFFNEWSKRYTPDMQRVLGDRVQHHLIDLTAVWNEVGAKRFIQDAIKYRGHWVGCLGCQESMATHLIIHSLSAESQTPSSALLWVVSTLLCPCP